MGELDLHNFIQAEQPGIQIELRNELIPVVERLATILPSEKMWEHFASSPTATGGRVVFPYCRVDSDVRSSRDAIKLIGMFNYTPLEIERWYKFASQRALTALVWVEVGFEGLENYAKSPTSVNWTSAIGHDLTAETRAEAIIHGEGKNLYNECLQTFVQYRTEHGIVEDCFREYGVEYLLEPFLEVDPG